MKLRFLVLLISLSFAHVGLVDGNSTIGYASVAEALSALKSDPRADVSVQGGWTIVSMEGDGKYILWSFTPDNHPAHPAAVKREIVESEGAIYISMNALCQASKAECDALIQEFKEWNSQIKKAIAGDI